MNTVFVSVWANTCMQMSEIEIKNTSGPFTFIIVISFIFEVQSFACQYQKAAN